MSTPRVSIIIPCHNAERWLGETLDSALEQSWAEKEIIVIDDGSTDKSAVIAQSYESRGVRIQTQANGGASSARNAGLKIATGDFIQFLDADDILAKDKIELQMKVLLASDPGMVASGSWGEFREDIADALFTPKPVWGNFTPVEWLACSWEGGGMMHPAAWLVPKDPAYSAGPWNENLSLDDDGEYFCRVLLQSKGILFVPEAKSYYRTHEGVRLSGSAGPKAARSSFTACELKEAHLLAAEDSPRTRRALASNYCRYAWEQFNVAPDLVERAIARWQELDPTVKAPRAGRMYNFLSSMLGWRLARRLQLARQRR